MTLDLYKSETYNHRTFYIVVENWPLKDGQFQKTTHVYRRFHTSYNSRAAKSISYYLIICSKTLEDENDDHSLKKVHRNKKALYETFYPLISKFDPGPYPEFYMTPAFITYLETLLLLELAKFK